jgi:hypothetical protein
MSFLETTPDLPDQELLYRIEHHLLIEMTSNITYGFADDDVEPPSLEEQKAFFEREDVRKGMREVILEVFRVTREEPEDGYNDDFYRQLIYDEGSLGSIYKAFEATRTKGAEGEFDDVEIEQLAYEDYTPLFPRSEGLSHETPVEQPVGQPVFSFAAQVSKGETSGASSSSGLSASTAATMELPEIKGKGTKMTAYNMYTIEYMKKNPGGGKPPKGSWETVSKEEVARYKAMADVVNAQRA